MGPEEAKSLEADIQKKEYLRRTICAVLGVLFVGIAAIGVFLPLIPTVGPLILASVFLTKSSPALERRLVRNKFFAKYLPYLDGTNELSVRARLMSILLMWTSIAVSYLVIVISGSGNSWLVTALLVAGAVGTIFILRFGKNSSKNQDPPETTI